ncbi:MAG: hypothetical protein EPN21_13930 [Methylococcaceae bacterium]|nr:MAG: hypothetical protein EPN21_13930 [Methylococcaceae bacterium]
MGISDTASLNFTTDVVPSSYVPGQAEIDLGAGYGKLIYPVNVDGNWYYYWDRSGDGSNAGVDTITHDALDAIFKYASDFTTINPAYATGNTAADDTNDTYRYAALNGVKLALPTQGDGQTVTGISSGYYVPGTAVGGAPASVGSTVTNSAYNDLLAIWDAYNGTGGDAGVPLYGVPSGWYDYNYYWSATPSASGHSGVYLRGGGVFDNYDTYDNSYVALEVL